MHPPTLRRSNIDCNTAESAIAVNLHAIADIIG
jgi:hypothetical protein